MSGNDLVEKENDSPIDSVVAKLTWLARLFAYLLLFLPVIVLAVVLLTDKLTTTETLFPYSNNPVEYFIIRNTGVIPQIEYEILFGYIFWVLTYLICTACLVFQTRTESALKDIEEWLGKKINKDTWISCIIFVLISWIVVAILFGLAINTQSVVIILMLIILIVLWIFIGLKILLLNPVWHKWLLKLYFMIEVSQL